MWTGLYYLTCLCETFSCNLYQLDFQLTQIPCICGERRRNGGQLVDFQSLVIILSYLMLSHNQFEILNCIPHNSSELPILGLLGVSAGTGSHGVGILPSLLHPRLLNWWQVEVGGVRVGNSSPETDKHNTWTR